MTPAAASDAPKGLREKERRDYRACHRELERLVPGQPRPPIWVFKRGTCFWEAGCCALIVTGFTRRDAIARLLRELSDLAKGGPL